MAKHKRKRNPARKRKRSKVLTIVILTFLSILSIGVLISITPICNISKVVVVGNKMVSSNSVISAVSLPIGGNIFHTVDGSFFDKTFMTWKTYKDKLTSKYPVIKSANFTFGFGGIVKITIVERVPFIYIPMKTKFALVDGDGVIIKVVKEKPSGGKLMLKGLKIAEKKAGEKVDISANEGVLKVKRLLKLFEKYSDEIPKQMVGKIIAFDIQKPSNIAIDFIDNKRVLLGEIGDFTDPDLIYRFNFIKSVMDKIKTGDAGVLDYSSTNNPIWSKK